MSEAPAEENLLRPFYNDGWPRDKRHHAKALWDFHSALIDPRTPALDGSDLTAYFHAEHDRALDAEPLSIVPSHVADEAYLSCSEFGLSMELLALQIAAARRFMEPVRFQDNRSVNAFISDWAGSHARLLAGLAGSAGSWQLVYADELATGFFWVGRLITLKRDVTRDHVYIPLSDLEQHGVSVEQLRRGDVDENMRRLLWKQTIRAKDAFAQSEQFVLDLPRRYAAAVKRWWFGGLEILNEIERRDYDVWSKPIRLSTFHRLQVRFQARFGRTTFRSR